MIKKVVLTLTTLLVSSAALAANSTQTIETEPNTNFVITPSMAYRYDVFKWSIPSDRFPQHKLSELVWKNHIVQPSIKIETEPKPKQFTFLGQAKYGYILKNPSKSWDYDWYSSDEKTSELHSKTKSYVRGNILDLSGAVGYSVNLLENNLLTFYVGYDYTDYRNKDYGCFQLLDINELTISYNQLISKYYFKNQVPWVGLSLETQLNNKFSIIPTIKYYSFKYIGRGYWLFRTDYEQNPSFKHNAKGYGLGVEIDFLYKYSNNLDFKIGLETKKFKMKNGNVKTFYSEKEKKSAMFNFGKKVSDTNKLYGLNLISSSISVGFRYKI
ncbi:MAG: hypothetical protein LBQ34_04675 [Alphaproteobacteria bacterium]|nr:hypothetical protein [Alphaproteobacteria bacterium]